MPQVGLGVGSGLIGGQFRGTRGPRRSWRITVTEDTVSTLEKLIAFYVNEHNTRLPHSAFQGQTRMALPVVRLEVTTFGPRAIWRGPDREAPSVNRAASVVA